MKIRILGLLVLMLLAVSKPAFAQCRTANTFYGGHYVAPTNAFAVQQHYNFDKVIVSKAFLVDTASVPFYLGVDNGYRQANFAKQLAEAIVEAQHAIGQPAQQQAGQTPAATQNAALTAKMREVISTKCVSCHSPGKEYPDLSGDPDSIPRDVRMEAFGQVTLGRMPPASRGGRLPQDEHDAFGAWSQQLKRAEAPKPKAPAAVEPPPAKQAVPDVPKEPAIPKAPKQEEAKNDWLKVGAKVTTLAASDRHPGYTVLLIEGENVVVKSLVDGELLTFSKVGVKKKE